MMSRPEQWLAAALLTAAVTTIPAPARADSVGSIERMDSGAGSVIFAAEDLPSRAELHPESVRVTIDGAVVDADIAQGAVVEKALSRRVAVLTVDTSGSMSGSGITAARDAAQAFLDAAPSDVEIGLVSFADAAKVLVPPTLDRVKVRQELGRLQASGDTTLYDGIVAAARAVGSEGERSIVVLSDGADTKSSSSVADAIRSLKASGASSHFVLYRTGGAAAAPVERIASATGARVQAAADGGQLAGTFTTAARAFDQRIVLSVPALEDLEPGTHAVSVSVGFGAVTLRAGDRLTIDAPASVAPSGGESTASMPPMPAGGAWLYLMLGAVFVALLAVGLAFLVPARPSRTARRFQELQSYTLDGSRSRPVMGGARQQASVANTVLDLSSRFVQRRGLTESIALKLDRANVRLRPHEWLVVQGCVTLTSAGVVGLVTGHVFAGGLVGGVLGYTITHVILGVRAGRRLKAFAQQLPDGLQLVASSLQSGFSLAQALDSASRDGRAPLSTELSRALNEARLGAPLEDALDRVADRMNSKDFGWAVMAVRIQREVGGNLAEVLRTTVATIRERAALHRQVRALSAEGRLSMYILMALPIGMFTFLVTMRGEYARLLWTEPLGLLMMAATVVSMTVGYFWMRTVIRVEV